MPLKKTTSPGWIREFREFVALLDKHGVRYVMLGGYAVGWHGHPRVTKDIDFLVERSRENAAKLVIVLEDFGLSCLGLKAADFLKEESVVYFGRPPFRIDLINFADGIAFDEAWATRIQTTQDGEPLLVISRDLLIKNKRATGRLQDLADVAALERRPPKRRTKKDR